MTYIWVCVLYYMGFSYSTNQYTSHMCLDCDFCGKNKSEMADYGHFKLDNEGYPIKKLNTWVKKIDCPYGWCQACATCNECFKLGKHKSWSSANPSKDCKNHESCKVRMAETRNVMDYP